MRVLLALCGQLAVASAAPLATLSEDVDGDGAIDRVELGSDGNLKIGSASISLGLAVADAKLIGARHGAGLRLIADINAKGRREAIVLERDRARGWQIATRFALGGVGLDREYGIELDVSDGIVRYQTRWDVQRCDERPALLFAERFDGSAFQRIDRVASGVPAGSPTLVARVDASAPGAPAPVIYQARAASHQAGARDAGELSIPRELDDGQLDTVWREDLPSQGEGQFFTFKARVEMARAAQLRIVPGAPTSAQTMQASARPHRLAIATKQGVWRVELPDAAAAALGTAYVVDLPPGLADCVTVVLEAVHGRGPTAIAELAIFAADERSGGAAPLLARVVADGRSGTTNAASALAKLGNAAARALDDELGRARDAATRHRLIQALIKVSDPAATTTLIRVIGEGTLSDRDLLAVIDALGDQPSTLRELAANVRLALEIRLAAVARLRPSGAGLTALAALAGNSNRELRRGVIERLSDAAASDLVALAGAAADAPVSGDLWRAATRAVRRDEPARAAVVAAMRAALATAGASDYERRYRLIEGIATLGDDAALDDIDRLLRGLAAGAQRAALTRVAINGIAARPRATATRLVIAALRDADPGVRLAALAAVATTSSDAVAAWHDPRGDGSEIDRVVINALRDTWPDVRRRAAGALAARCQREAPARALFETIAKDRDLDVRSDALTAVVQCKARGVAELLRQTWETDKQPIQLRQHAIGLVVALADSALAAGLVGRFSTWRSQALDSKDAMDLAQAAAATIGRMAAPGAAAALLPALDDVAFPELVSAAALGLGALGSACPAAARTKLEQLARGDERLAVEARRAARQCRGK